MNLLSRQTVLRQLIGRHIRSCYEPQVVFFNKSAHFSKDKKDKEAVDEENNEPVKYFGSQAATWTAKQSHYNQRYDQDLWYQPFVISGSLAIFLIYFCILREENDIDEKLSMSLYDRIEGLEEHQLEASIQYNKAHGMSTLELEKRLKELRPTES